MIPYNNNPQLDHHHHHHQAAAAAAAVAAHQAAAAAAIYPVTAALDIQTGGGHHAKPSPGKQLFVKMPRVVPKQRERFEEEELFKRNVREMEVKRDKLSRVEEKRRFLPFLSSLNPNFP